MGLSGGFMVGRVDLGFKGFGRFCGFRVGLVWFRVFRAGLGWV